MTPDEQEALSRRYGNDIIIVMALRSTNWAIFDSRRELIAIVPAGQIQEAAIELAIQAANRETRRIKRDFEDHINLEELGL